jgi:hypothetical protein
MLTLCQSLPLLCVVLFFVSWVEWWVFGRKGDAMLTRSPRVIFWVCMEVLLCAAAGYGLFEAYSRKVLFDAICLIGSTIVGAALGVGTSGLIDWRKHERTDERTEG